MDIVLISVGIILMISVYVSNNSATKIKGNVLLSVTLPLEGLKNKEVLEIVSGYKKSNIKFIIGSSIAFIPSLFMTYMSCAFLYLFLWTLVLVYGSNKISIKYNEKLMNIKRKNNWFLPSKHLITIDTEVSRMKDKMIISKLWFIPSIIMSIVPIVIAFNEVDIWGSSIIVMSCTSLISTVVFILIYRRYSVQRTEVFCEDTKVNLACNTIYKRTWTSGCVTAATIQSISMILLFLVLMMDINNEILFVLIVMIPAVIVALGIYYINNKVRSEQNRLISTSEKPIYTDNDEYWKNDVYNNPNDRRVMIEKRVGYGLTYNVATRKGKIITYGSYVFSIFVPLAIIVMLFAFDFTKFKLEVDNNLVSISAPIYGTTFNIDDIEEVKMIDSFPKLLRTNGAGTDRYSLGNFSVDGYGKSKLYIYNQNPPYIAIKLKGEYVFINGTTEDETNEYYEVLMKSLEQ